MRVLIVEDNQDLAANLLDYLTVKGCQADYAMNGRQALSLVEEMTYDVIVLDIMMSGIDGLEVCQQLRNRMLHTPVIFLTARDSLDDKAAGFQCGGDDYMVKPFASEELYVRLQGLAKRRFYLQPNRLQVADLVMDLTSQEVSRAGKRLRLNRSCSVLLRCLMQNSPEVVSRQTLNQLLWGTDQPEHDVLRSHLYTLRKAIDKDFSEPLLHTVHGVGFCLKSGGADA